MKRPTRNVLPSLGAAALALALTTGFACAAETAPVSAPRATGVSAALPRLRVPADVMTTLHAALPDHLAVSPALLSPTFDPNLTVSTPATVSVTFLWDGAVYHNAFGYFTWRAGADGVEILDRQLVFPDASRASLRSGQTVQLRDADGDVRTFEPGTRIGFFLVADGWDGKAVRGFDPESPQIPATESVVNARAGVLTTVDSLNPEIAAGAPRRARHTAMVRMPGEKGFLGGRPFYVMGMEDALRTGKADDDFNDLVFLVRADRAVQAVDGAADAVDAANAVDTPDAVDPLQATHVLTGLPGTGDADGDGVVGLRDFFPNDPTRATVLTHPAGTLRSRDGVAVPVSTEQVIDGHGATRELVGTFHRDAQPDGDVVSFAHLPAGTSGTIRVERFTDTGEHSPIAQAPLSRYLVTEPDGRLTLRYPRFFAPGAGGEVRISVVFDTPVPAWSHKAVFPWHVEAAAPLVDRHASGLAPYGPIRGASGALVDPQAVAPRIVPQMWRLHAGD